MVIYPEFSFKTKQKRAPLKKKKNPNKQNRQKFEIASFLYLLKTFQKINFAFIFLFVLINI